MRALRSEDVRSSWNGPFVDVHLRTLPVGSKDLTGPAGPGLWGPVPLEWPMQVSDTERKAVAADHWCCCIRGQGQLTDDNCVSIPGQQPTPWLPC